MLGGADNPNGELLSYIIGADNAKRDALVKLWKNLNVKRKMPKPGCEQQDSNTVCGK